MVNTNFSKFETADVNEATIITLIRPDAIITDALDVL